MKPVEPKLKINTIKNIIIKTLDKLPSNINRYTLIFQLSQRCQKFRVSTFYAKSNLQGLFLSYIRN